MLHVISGKVASGKSMLSAELGAEAGRTVISEDAWLSVLFGDRMRTLADYAEFAARLREVIGPMVVDMLRAGLDVVLDFAANRPKERAWMLGLAQAAGVPMRLYYLEAEDALCLERLEARNALCLERIEASNAVEAHEFAVSAAEFEAMTRHFKPPKAGEGYELIRIPQG